MCNSMRGGLDERSQKRRRQRYLAELNLPAPASCRSSRRAAGRPAPAARFPDRRGSSRATLASWRRQVTTSSLIAFGHRSIWSETMKPSILMRLTRKMPHVGQRGRRALVGRDQPADRDAGEIVEPPHRLRERFAADILEQPVDAVRAAPPSAPRRNAATCGRRRRRSRVP